MKRMITILNNNRGEGHINTAVKIIIAVVVGALLLRGLYLLFSGENGVVALMDSSVNDMMNFGEDGVRVQATPLASGSHALQYSYDGKRWLDVNMPDYGESAALYGTVSGGEGENASHAALIQDGNTYYMIASEDGINWRERFSFTATAITHFYYGTDAALPWTSGSFEGNKFVLRYCQGGGTYFSPTASNATNWTNGGWSDMIPIS